MVLDNLTLPEALLAVRPVNRLLRDIVDSCNPKTWPLHRLYVHWHAFTPLLIDHLRFFELNFSHHASNQLTTNYGTTMRDAVTRLFVSKKVKTFHCDEYILKEVRDLAILHTQELFMHDTDDEDIQNLCSRFAGHALHMTIPGISNYSDFSSFVHLRHLDINSPNSKRMHRLYTITALPENLESLTIDNCEATLALETPLVQLRIVNLQGVAMTPDTIACLSVRSDVSFFVRSSQDRQPEHILQICAIRGHLNINDYPNQTLSCYSLIENEYGFWDPVQQPNVKELVSTPRLNRVIANMDLEKMLRTFPSLEKLTIQNVFLKGSAQFTNLPHLKSLDICSFSSTFVSCMPNLTRLCLSVSVCSKHVLHNLPQLSELHLYLKKYKNTYEQKVQKVTLPPSVTDVYCHGDNVHPADKMVDVLWMFDLACAHLTLDLSFIEDINRSSPLTVWLKPVAPHLTIAHCKKTPSLSLYHVRKLTLFCYDFCKQRGILCNTRNITHLELKSCTGVCHFQLDFDTDAMLDMAWTSLRTVTVPHIQTPKTLIAQITQINTLRTKINQISIIHTI